MSIEKKDKKHRMVIFLSSILFVLFLTAGTIWAYEYRLEKMEKCSVNSDGVCYNTETFGSQERAIIKNLEEDKKYRVVVKKKISDEKTIEIGSVEVDGGSKDSLKINCLDSDGGKGYYMFGEVTYNGAAFKDSCSSNYLLLEHYCENDTLEKTEVTCPVGCENGACKLGFYGDLCLDNDGCGPDTVCKASGRYPATDLSHSESYCCHPDQCASVIPGPGIIDFETAIAPHCVDEWGTDEAMDGSIIMCENGSYVATY